MTSQTMHTVHEILLDLGLPADELRPSATLRDDLELDSTETIEVVLAVRRRLGATIEIEAGTNPSLEEIERLIDAAVAAGSAAA